MEVLSEIAKPRCNRQMKATQLIPLDFLEGAERSFVLRIKQKPARGGRSQAVGRLITLKDFKADELVSR
jgi:hypothetical protein